MKDIRNPTLILILAHLILDIKNTLKKVFVVNNI